MINAERGLLIHMIISLRLAASGVVRLPSLGLRLHSAVRAQRDALGDRAGLQEFAYRYRIVMSLTKLLAADGFYIVSRCRTTREAPS